MNEKLKEQEVSAGEVMVVFFFLIMYRIGEHNHPESFFFN